MTIGIYILTNKVNNKKYIGQSINIEKRLGEHKNTPKSLIGKAILKYGFDSFNIEIYPTNEEDLDLVEMLQILKNKTFLDRNKGYNLTLGGESSRGYKHRAESIEVMKQKALDRMTDAVKKSHSEKMTGRKLSDEHKQKISDFNIGKSLSNEHKLKIGLAHKGKKGRPLSLEEKEYRRKLKLGTKVPDDSKLECPHCHMKIAKQMANRWHFDNCKLKD